MKQPEIDDLIESQDVASLFEEHVMPEDAVTVTAHIVSDENQKLLEDFMSKSIPDCYIPKLLIDEQKSRTGLSTRKIVANKIPETGNIKSGDFAEILTLFFLGSGNEEFIKKIKKWRFKQDKHKAAPHSDVVVLRCEDPLNPSINDFVICAEAKSKAIKSNSYRPIANAIDGYEKDRTGRLSRTLTWLREKAIEFENSDSIALIERFTKSNIEVTFKKKYRAVIVIDRNLLDEELQVNLDIPPQNDEFEVVVLGITELKPLYESCFSKALSELDNG